MANTISTDRTSYPIGSNVFVSYTADVSAYIAIYKGLEVFDEAFTLVGSGTVQFPTPAQGWVYNPGTYTARLIRYSAPYDTLAEVSIVIQSLEPPPDTLGCYLGNGVWNIDSCNADIMTNGVRGAQLTSVPGNVGYTVYILRTRSNCGFVSGEIAAAQYYYNGQWFNYSQYDPLDSNGYSWISFYIAANPYRYWRIVWADCIKQWEQTSPICAPNWQCELPLNGYEFDGCGNRRLNPSCNPSPILTVNSYILKNGIGEYDCNATTLDKISFGATVTGLTIGQLYKCQWSVKKDLDPETNFISDMVAASPITTFSSTYNNPLLMGSYTITYVIIYDELNFPVWSGVP